MTDPTNINAKIDMPAAQREEGAGSHDGSSTASETLLEAPRRSPGQLAYEADLIAFPWYNDGGARPTWAKLDGAARGSWERNPTPRNWRS